jgi:aldose 1-epimerase
MNAIVTSFGKIGDHAVQKILLSSSSGMSMALTTYGATILSIKVPSRGGGPAEEVTLCHGSLRDLQASSPYFGATCGRVANRIAKGRFMVDGKSHSLAVNNGENALHGGLVGFDKVLWEPRVYVTPSAAGVEFSYTSPAGEEGYPGTLLAKADYRLTAANEVRMEFSATTDAPTPVNMCNHAYYNLSGDCKASIHDHVLQLHMPFYTPTDATQIPTGEIAPVTGTHFDFTAPTRVGDRIMGVDGGGKPGYDHNYVRVRSPPAGGLANALFPIAELSDPASGRVMKVATNAPGVQLYTGNWLDEKAGAEAHRALCLETQMYPDAVNKEGVEGWPEAVLRAFFVFLTWRCARPSLFLTPRTTHSFAGPSQSYRHIALHTFSW